MAAKKVTRGRSSAQKKQADAVPPAAKSTIKKKSSLDPGAAEERRSSARWTFLTNHAHVLIALHARPDLVLREVAVEVGITERAVQRIVQDLEEEGFIRREKVGRKNHYEVLADQALRHPIEAHRNIGDLLKLITG
nr:MarR family transcriptional regulator [Rhodopirellula europaea]|tara:strand:- start:12596 stop:13003 length:408 start_codon:yes stop_codon:yes gene_type:complete